MAVNWQELVGDQQFIEANYDVIGGRYHKVFIASLFVDGSFILSFAVGYIERYGVIPLIEQWDYNPLTGKEYDKSDLLSDFEGMTDINNIMNILNGGNTAMTRQVVSGI